MNNNINERINGINKKKSEKDNLEKNLDKNKLSTNLSLNNSLNNFDKYILSGIFIIIFIVAIFAFTTFPYNPFHKTNLNINSNTNTNSNDLTGNVVSLEPSSPEEMYKKFKCSCCGESIDANCCGMAKQRMEHVDKLMLSGMNENEVTVEMVKMFGFDILMDSSEEGKVRKYIAEQASDNPPKIDISPITKNLGTISQEDGIISTFFEISNDGKSDLVIENMDTSCMCTSARIIYDGKKGPIFGMSMHGENPKDYKLTIPPGESAKLEVLYDPLAHGKQKKPEVRIVREVTIISNDPVNFQKKVRIELVQTK